MIRILILILILKGTLMAIEEPKYTIIEKNDTFEIREYAPYIVAQTEVKGTFDEMGGKAFRILVKYISGENQKQYKITMTAPVIQEMEKSDTKSAIFSFVMPQSFTLDTLPLPLDKRIRLKEIPAKTVAVRTYSGSWSEEKYRQNEAILLKALKEAKIETIGQAIFARYNSPFALWFMRRNEIMIGVKR